MSQIIPEVIEPELVVGPVGNVGPVRRAFLIRRLVGINNTNAHTQKLVNGFHPLRVTLGQIFVHRNQVHASTGKRVQVRRQRGDEGLTLTGAHFRDLVIVKRRAADQLNIKVSHSQGADRCLTDRRERFAHHRLEAFATLHACFQGIGKVFEIVVGLLLILGFQLIGCFDDFTI